MATIVRLARQVMDSDPRSFEEREDNIGCVGCDAEAFDMVDAYREEHPMDDDIFDTVVDKVAAWLTEGHNPVNGTY